MLAATNTPLLTPTPTEEERILATLDEFVLLVNQDDFLTLNNDWHTSRYRSENQDISGLEGDWEHYASMTCSKEYALISGEHPWLAQAYYTSHGQRGG